MALNIKPPLGHDEFEKYLETLFNISDDDAKIIIRDFHSEMQKGLTDYDSSLLMIPSFVGNPKGDEKGEFIALDLGGTNFRVLAVRLDGKGNSTRFAVSKYGIKKKDTQGSGEQLFNFIAECIKGFMEENEISFDKTIRLGMTFSFEVEQTSIDSGILLAWSKGFTAQGVEGKDIVVLLDQALKRFNINNIKIAALTNDTVGTLVSTSYNDPSCDIGVILGTGTNACYLENTLNIKKWAGKDHKGDMIINMEWGGFDKLPSLTYYDRKIDAASSNPGEHKFEKLVAGMYLGEIVRLIICDLVKRGLIFQANYKNPFKKPGTFLTEDMSLIANDTSENLEDVEKFLIHSGVENVTPYSKQFLKRICRLVSLRSARLAAVAVAAVVTWMDPELKNKHTVAIDGSLFEKYPGYGSMMRPVFTKLYEEKAENISIVRGRGGSGKGTAIVAAIAATSDSYDEQLQDL